ncbi:hypothetical protein GRX03_16210 [Halovenus sp. WSH3]|uniref:Uncharacterized protein n=1 Tax=Halovenus carboxidivorans TaxID=2692199 RepID=A0A6B0T4F1_9EURY|nr:hypothetical protein [Halovenus carboxidivorans]MXR53138.1 hypothetical protein [Halovenus carboxidivorans]
MNLRSARKRTAIVALCGVLVLLAGCNGLSALGDDGASEGESGDGEGVATRLANVSETHAQYLRSAGNVTVTRTVRVSTEARDLTQTTRWRIDFESGRVYKAMEPLAGTPSETFRTANGTVYERLGSGTEQFVPPEQTDSLALEEAVGLSTALGPTVDRYERRGTRTVNGVDATVYVADEIDAAPRAYRENLSSADVRRYRSVVVVAPTGYVVNETAALTVDLDVGTRRIRETVRFSDPGRTTVERPEWVDEARRQARQPGPDDVVTRTYNATGDGGLVELNVTAEKGELDPAATVGPQISENPIYRNDLLNSVRVGSIARYYFLLDTVERVEVRIHYDQSQIAAENESKLRVAVRNDTDGWWDLLNTSVDERRNVVTATITDPEDLEKYQGKTMIAMRFETFVQRLRERSRR